MAFIVPTISPSLVPRLSGTRNEHTWKAWYIFSCDHDVIKIGNRTRVFRTERQRFVRYSTSFAFNARCVWYSLPDSYICVVSFPLPSLFSLFWVLGYAHVQLRSFYRLSTFEGSHVRKNTRLSPHAHVQFLVPEWRSLGTRLHLAWDYK